MTSSQKPNCTTYSELAEYGTTFSCLVCVDVLSSPRTLSCDHVFCETCLEAYVRLFGDPGQPADEDASIPCPICRKSTLEVRKNGTATHRACHPGSSEFPFPFRKESVASEAGQRCEACLYRGRVDDAEFFCAKCAMNFCGCCKLIHDQTQVFRGHTVIHVRNKDTLSLYCDAHARVVCVYFCHDCDYPVCTVCLLHVHRTHRAVKLRDALSGRRDVLKTVLNDFGPTLERLEMKIRKICQIRMSTGCGNDGVVAADAGSQARVRKNAILNGGVRNSDASFRRSPNLIANGGGGGGGDAASAAVSSVGELSVHFRRSSGLVGGGSGNIDDLVEHVTRNRKLYVLSTKLIELSQSKRLLTVYQAVVSRLRTVIEGEFQRLHDALEEHLTRAMESSARATADAPKDLDSGSSSSSSIRGRHSSGVSVNSGADQDSDGASQSMLIRPKLIWKLEKQRSDVGEMWNPCGAAFINEDGGLIVAEYDAVNDRNNKLRIFTGEGRSHAVLAQGRIQPLGVAVTRDGHVAVTDCKDKRVKILTLNGQTVCEIGKGQFGWPYGIAANSRGNLVITDAFNDSVSVFQPDGKRVRQFGSSGSQNSQFRNPYHVTVDAGDNILVSDSGNNCIKAFDPSGRFLFMAADTGLVRRSTDSDAAAPPPERKTKRRRLKGPRGLSVDQRGNVLVADDCSRVCMFDSAGKYVRNLLTEEDSVKYPEVVSCGPKGLLVVTEWNPANMYAVKVFKLYE